MNSKYIIKIESLEKHDNEQSNGYKELEHFYYVKNNRDKLVYIKEWKIMFKYIPGLFELNSWKWTLSKQLW